MPKVRVEAGNGDVIYESDGESTFFDADLARLLRLPCLAALGTAYALIGGKPPMPGEMGGPQAANQDSRVHILPS